MKNRMPRTLALVGTLVLALSACSMQSTPIPTPTPTPDESPAAESPLGSISFSDGADLPPETDVKWGDGFAHDDDWEEIEHPTRPGIWTYANVSETCNATFRNGTLGDAQGMDDTQASDALLNVQLSEQFGELDGLIYDGAFIRHNTKNARIDHRQVSITVNGLGVFMAARAFVALDYDVSVLVVCEGVDVSGAAGEVLSKNVVSIETPTS